MRKFLIPAAAAALVAVSSLAFANSNTVGTIKTFDSKAMTVTLQDGTMFYLNKANTYPDLKAGQKVSINWTMEKSQHDADSIKVLN